MQSFESFVADAEEFLNRALLAIHEKTIPLEDHWQIDHLCYRVASQESYSFYKRMLEKSCVLLIESQVNGRLISTFKLPKPVAAAGRLVNLIELPAPKKSSSYDQGFEHIEIVVDVRLEDLQRKFSHLTGNIDGLEKPYNAELVLKLGSGINVKFHHYSLESVIRLEKKDKVYKSLLESRVLEELREFYPLVAGTFPLDLDRLDSDLDICVFCDSLDKLGKKLDSLYRDYEGFHLFQNRETAVPCVVCNFFVDEVAFEIYGEETESYKQRAYQHFLIEERLLKLGGDKFHSRVQSFRDKGYKTEPAFAKALKLQGDPYLELLNCFPKCDADLLKRFENLSLNP